MNKRAEKPTAPLLAEIENIRSQMAAEMKIDRLKILVAELENIRVMIRSCQNAS